ncbi:hypothetical protein L873DRAFT_1819455 [Choiromyces venosus 120613-1]|uniref:3-phosphoshikimate 1-carboxyvinyltransferase n=1 Tax=Choiromyces venosus 120613-1 TaxID=1336337 RepID=A0A3N4IZV3_9PEZI|nr:hypothetical protein L873DRAFT_1819455 [Choiromyces venosus 120613-1]
MSSDSSSAVTTEILGKDTINVGYDLTDSITADILQCWTSSTYLLIIDTNLAPLYLPTFESSFNKNAPKYSPEARLLSYTILPGEYSKSLTTKAEVEDWILSGKCTCDTVVIALGVVFIQVPTTLLAMVDSLIGGKAAIGLPHGKNLIGAFWRLERVFIDMKFLETLREREFINGMAEVVKTAAIWDEAEFSRLEQNAELILETVKAKSSDSGRAQIGNVQNVFKDVILGFLRVKVYVVSADERKGGLRNLLNFGHSIGYANEAIIFAQMLHGECVAIGMIKEAELARHLRVCKPGAVARLSKCLTSYGLPISLEDKRVKKLTGGKHCEVERMLTIMGDKKNDGRKKKVVLLKATVINDDSSLRSAVPELENLLHSDDTEHMLTALYKLEDGDILVLHACGDEFQTSITALVSPSGGPDSIVLTGNARMKSAVEYLESQGSLPVRVPSTSGLTGRRIEFEAKVSSQYVSSILMCAPYACEPVTLSLLYIDMTVAMMAAFGIEVTKSTTDDSYKNPAEYVVESDAAMTGSSKSLQGDARFAEDSDYSTTLKPLPHVDMEPMIDAFLTASVLAAVANGSERTFITSIANQRVKECNRIAAMIHKLGKFDGIWIQGIEYNSLKPPEGGVHCYDDHRVAIIILQERKCVERTWPGRWDILGIELLDKSQVKEESVKKGSNRAGKTTMGIRAAKIFNRPLLDLDTVLEEEQKSTIPEIIKEHDWDGIRKHIKAYPNNYIFACGGGIVETPATRDLLKQYSSTGGIVVHVMEFLNIDKTRPVYVEDMAAVWNRRKSWYSECSNYQYYSPIVSENLSRFLAIVTGNSDYHERLLKKTRSFFEATHAINAVRIYLLVDPTDSNGVATLAGLKGKTQLPISQGGKFPNGDHERALELYITALRMGLESIDLEITWPVALLERVTSSKGYSKIIASHNDVCGDLRWSNASWISKFNGTLKYESIQDNYDPENFRKLVNMGEKGKLSRILNSFLTPAAQGQLSIDEILQALSLIGMLEAKIPALHNTLFYDDFGRASVTIPDKVSIIPLLSSISAQAQVIGAVNTVIPVIADDGTRKPVGDNFDWCGIPNSPRNRGVTEQENPSAVTALIIGAGGTSLVVVYALHKIGYGKIDVGNSTPENLKSLVEAFPKQYNLVAINSLAEAKSVGVKPITAVSTVPADKPVDDALKAIFQKLLTRGVSARVLAEMAYKARVREVMNLAEGAGWKVVPGLLALAGQGVGQFEVFFTGGIVPDYGVS